MSINTKLQWQWVSIVASATFEHAKDQVIPTKPIASSVISTVCDPLYLLICKYDAYIPGTTLHPRVHSKYVRTTI